MNNKILKIFTIILNIVGIICLIYFAIPFITHDMNIPNPNAMLAGYSWDTCGFVLTLGLLPLVVANTLAFIFIKLDKKILKCLFYIPSLICFVLVAIYLFMDFSIEEETYESVLLGTQKCVLNGKVYHYSVYQEEDGTYSVGMDEDDKMPLSVINYNSPNEIAKSIEIYYKDKGGMCP